MSNKMENTTKKHCPMSYNANREMFCIGNRCAWWIEGLNRCAIPALVVDATAPSATADEKESEEMK